MGKIVTPTTDFGICFRDKVKVMTDKATIGKVGRGLPPPFLASRGVVLKNQRWNL